MPSIDLTEQDLDVVRTSLGYSKQHIADESAPYELKQEKLAQVDEVLRKLTKTSA